MPVLHVTLARILNFMDCMSLAGTIPRTSVKPHVRDEAQTSALEGAYEDDGEVYQIGSSQVHRCADEDVNEFLVSCEERLHNLGLIESHGIDFSAYKLEGPAKQ
ncbi:hypothetical protein KY284_032696 [Solanum tuberosum]|nr:hypothetical protein KY284_032696 [Solanum tuberosum]